MQIHVTATWTSTHVIDTDDLPAGVGREIDWEDLNAWPVEALDMVTSGGASLTDWEVAVS